MVCDPRWATLFFFQPELAFCCRVKSPISFCINQCVWRERMGWDEHNKPFPYAVASRGLGGWPRLGNVANSSLPERKMLTSPFLGHCLPQGTAEGLKWNLWCWEAPSPWEKSGGPGTRPLVVWQEGPWTRSQEDRVLIFLLCSKWRGDLGPVIYFSGYQLFSSYNF